jgi:hypothetical protein
LDEEVDALLEKERKNGERRKEVRCRRERVQLLPRSR